MPELHGNLADSGSVQEMHDCVLAVTKSLPDAPAPLVNCRITLSARWRSKDIDRCHYPTICRQRQSRILAGRLREQHVDALNLLTRESPLDVQEQASECKYKAHRLGVLSRRLGRVRVNDVLQDETRSPHRVDVEFVVRSSILIHKDVQKGSWPCRVPRRLVPPC